MPMFAPALIKKVKKVPGLKGFFFSHSNGQCYYKARHKSEDLFIMWIESRTFGSIKCYPCVLEEQGDSMVYHTVNTKENKKLNTAIMQRWPLFVTPQNITTDWDITEMENPEFFDEYRIYQKRYIDSEMAKCAPIEGEVVQEPKAIEGAPSEAEPATPGFKPEETPPENL